MANAPDMTILHNFPGAALDAAIEGARISDPLFLLPDGVRHLALPKDFNLHDVSDKFARPPYIICHPQVDDRQSLIDYTNRFSDHRSIIVADYTAGKITARLDWHGSNQAEASDALTAQPDKHRCTLMLLPSEEFSRWDAFEMSTPKTGGMHTQAEFAAFLEENANDVVIPDPTTLIEISRDLEAVQDVQFASRTRLESGDRTFYYETETKTKGEMKVPRQFTLNIPLYNGEPAIMIECALRFTVGAGGLFLGFEWRRVEYQRRAHFNAIAQQVAEATGRPLIFGR